MLALGSAVLCVAAVPAEAGPRFAKLETPTDIVSVNFVDRLLRGGGGERSRSSTHKRKRSSAKRPAAPSPDKASTPAAPSAKTSVVAPSAGVLPMTGPVPLTRPMTKMEDPAPAPEPTPAKPPLDTPPPAPSTQGGPKESPVPAEKPDGGPPPTPEPSPPDGKAVEKGTAAEDADSQPEIVHEDPALLKTCLADLQALGTRFSRIDPIKEVNGCGIEAPIKVDALLPGLSLGGAVMRCETARSLARWVQTSVQPGLAVARPGRKITSLKPGTTFACRLRNNASSGMISEHARGNGFDVAAFELDNGDGIEMKPRQDDHTLEGAFQKAATAGACLFFTTVLAPGSDTAHETHLHVDVKERKNGYRICESM